MCITTGYGRVCNFTKTENSQIIVQNQIQISIFLHELQVPSQDEHIKCTNEQMQLSSYVARKKIDELHEYEYQCIYMIQGDKLVL